MANLKEIRNRIVSVSSTMQITSAMKMVSAAKLKKAQDAITSMRPYVSKLNNLIQNLSSSLEPDMNSPFVSVREKNSILLVAITSNRGLCGAFNSNVIKKTRQLVEEFSKKNEIEPERPNLRNSKIFWFIHQFYDRAELCTR